MWESFGQLLTIFYYVANSNFMTWWPPFGLWLLASIQPPFIFILFDSLDYSFLYILTLMFLVRSNVKQSCQTILLTTYFDFSDLTDMSSRFLCWPLNWPISLISSLITQPLLLNFGSSTLHYNYLSNWLHRFISRQLTKLVPTVSFNFSSRNLSNICRFQLSISLIYSSICWVFLTRSLSSRKYGSKFLSFSTHTILYLCLVTLHVVINLQVHYNKIGH